MLAIRHAPRALPSHTTPCPKVHSQINQRVARVRSYATSFPIVVDPKAIVMQFKEQVNTRKWNLETPLEPWEKKRVVKEIIENNPRTSLTELFSKKHWSIESFNQPHLPTVLGQVIDKDGFSKRMGDKYHLFMDMPIKLVGKGWKIPKELERYRELIERSARFERLINPSYVDYNVYLTIDQRPVEAGKSQRRTGWHSDSYISVETRVEALEKKPLIETDSIYLASDCIPTEFCAGPFPFDKVDPNNDEQVLEHFEKSARGKDVVTFPSYTLVRIGPECIHRVGLNTLNRTIARTFLKITFTKQLLNRQGNGLNPLFDVNWPMYPRKADKRNHSNLISGYFPNAELHRMLEPSELAGMFNKSPAFAVRTTPVSGYLATPGELLVTETNGFATTVNVAKPGDWKIKSRTGSMFFLSSEKIEQLYDIRELGMCHPKPLKVPYVELKERVKLMAPWGSLQFLREGDVVVKRGNEMYGVLKEDFKSNYARLDFSKGT